MPANWRRKSLVFKRVYHLACRFTRRSKHQLMVMLGAPATHHSRNAQRVSSGECFRFERFLMAARMAKISDAHAAVLWAREQLPDEYEHLREYIGCTLGVPKTRHFAGTGKRRDPEAGAEARALVAEHAPKARRVENP